jgi:uncharacterized protein (UPF0335 family)
MLKLFIVTALMTATLAQAKEITASEKQLKSCIANVYVNAAGKGDTKTMTKSVSEGVKACRAEVREIKKAERLGKRKQKLQEQIKKLQVKLAEIK